MTPWNNLRQTLRPGDTRLDVRYVIVATDTIGLASRRVVVTLLPRRVWYKWSSSASGSVRSSQTSGTANERHRLAAGLPRDASAYFGSVR